MTDSESASFADLQSSMISIEESKPKLTPGSESEGADQAY